MLARRLGPWILLACCPAVALGYGYGSEDDPLLLTFRKAATAAQGGDLGPARALLPEVQWQVEELRAKDDLGLDVEPMLRQAHGPNATPAGALQAWANLLYLGMLQKFHWNLQEKLADYHKARARLESAAAYYEAALAGNVRQDDARRKAADPAAPSRHADITAQFTAARTALGSPGLFGAGQRPPDVPAFEAAVRRIVGHLNAVFPTFVRPRAR
ncbi:MAG: hypothetical protein R3F62_19375 [Planctomycetota bacterium]